MTSQTDQAGSDNGAASRRWVYVSLGLLVFGLGILSRRQQIGNIYWDKYLGDALYAVMFYLCLAIIWPSKTILLRILATSVFVICIECFQLTGIPLQLRESGNTLAKVVSIVLGTKFGWPDMIAYFVGIGAIAAADQAITGDSVTGDSVTGDGVAGDEKTEP